MKPRNLIILIIAITFMILPSGAQAELGGEIMLRDISLSVEQVNDLSEYPLLKNREGILLIGTGEGEIECNGVALCEKKDLQGEIVGIKQYILLDMDPTGSASGGKFKTQTSGQFTKFTDDGTETFTFRGTGTTRFVKFGGETHLFINLSGRVRNCGTLEWSLASINIDHTSAGIVLQDVEGTVWLSLAAACLYDVGADMKSKLEGIQTRLITVFDTFDTEDLPPECASLKQSALDDLSGALSITSEMIAWTDGCKEENGCQLNLLRMPLMGMLQHLEGARTALTEIIIYTGHADQDPDHSGILDGTISVVEKALRASLNPEKTLSDSWWNE